jgi:hypothetical protein
VQQVQQEQQEQQQELQQQEQLEQQQVSLLLFYRKRLKPWLTLQRIRVTSSFMIPSKKLSNNYL